MIRMGRSSRTEPANETNYQGQPQEAAPVYQYSSETASSPSTRAVTDSESMARDIKEGRLSGFVGHGTTLTGETEFQAMLRVDGHLVGTVSSDSGTLIVGTNGQVDANVAVSSAMINGSVNGDIIATEKIQLGRTSRVIGNVQTPRLLVEDGAVLEGSCTMLKAREASEKQETEAQSQYKAAELARYEAETKNNVETDEYLGATDEDDNEIEEEDKSESAAV
ncbi:MAG: polymer-forming cytoskeletal protein [Acidobacteriota bacterium]|nr:polymer-forming cytoskeletal protein [Acidobacteriota bacterium]